MNAAQVERSGPLEVVGRPDRHAQIAEAARKFEMMFAQMLVKSMRETAQIGGGQGMFGEGPGSDTYADWFDGLMAEQIGGSGGLGLQKVLLREWDREAGAGAGAGAGIRRIDHVVT